MTLLAERVAARFVLSFGKEGASKAREDMELAWAYCDAWPTKTLCDPNLRFEIMEKVKSVSDAQLYITSMFQTQKELKLRWPEFAQELRNLRFRSRKWLSLADFVPLMQDICPRYNGFYVKKIGATLLHPEAEGKFQIQVARDGSPTLYFKGEAAILDWIRMIAAPAMKADEADIQSDGTLRLWWD